MLAAIHAFALTRSQRPSATPARPFRDRTAGAAEAAGTPSTVTGPSTALRQGLRASGGAPCGPGEDGPCWLLRVDPRDGAACVFRDAPVVAHFSRAVDPASVSAATFRVWGEQGPIPGAFCLSPDACVLIWEAGRPFQAHVHHFVTISRLRDARGREVSSHLSRFLTCDLMRHDLSG